MLVKPPTTRNCVLCTLAYAIRCCCRPVLACYLRSLREGTSRQIGNCRAVQRAHEAGGFCGRSHACSRYKMRTCMLRMRQAAAGDAERSRFLPGGMADRIWGCEVSMLTQCGRAGSLAASRHSPEAARGSCDVRSKATCGIYPRALAEDGCCRADAWQLQLTQCR